MVQDRTYDPQGQDRQRLRLLSYNIQVGIATTRRSHYVTKGWQHLLPTSNRQLNLRRIAWLIEGFDLVGLQELDGGSLRSGFVNQIGYLAQMARFPFSYEKINRKLSVVARHSLGALTRHAPQRVTRHSLPGRLPGRGALLMRFGEGGAQDLLVVIAHLALSRKARLEQVEYLASLMQETAHVIMMGDLNCGADSEELRLLRLKADLRLPVPGLLTFPSWRPERHIDHILVSGGIRVRRGQVINYPLSDHLPVALEVMLPQGLKLPTLGVAAEGTMAA